MRWLLAFIFLLPGCAELLVEDGASAWSWESSDSMLPDFEGEGESYPVIVVHKHEEWSQRQKEDFEKNPWVCADLAGNEIPVHGPDLDHADMAPCPPPQWDQGTGRLFMDPEEFQEWDASAVAILGSSCEGGLLPMSGPEPGFQFDALEHTFRIEWKGDHFLVDGHRLDKGDVLKATYWVSKGDELDQRFVRASFDFPGYWLTSNVGKDTTYQQPPVPGAGSFVDGELLDLEIKAFPDSMGDVLGPLADRTQAIFEDEVSLADASIVITDGRITELVLGMRAGEDSIRWYMASRDGEVLRVLGNATEPVGGGMPMGRAADAIWDREWVRYPVGIAEPVTTRFTFVPDQAWMFVEDMLPAIPAPATCEECVYGLREALLGDEDFHYAPDAVEASGEAATWRIDHHQADGSMVRGYYAIEAS